VVRSARRNRAWALMTRTTGEKGPASGRKAVNSFHEDSDLDSRPSAAAEGSFRSLEFGERQNGSRASRGRGQASARWACGVGAFPTCRTPRTTRGPAQIWQRGSRQRRRDLLARITCTWAPGFKLAARAWRSRSAG